MLTDIHFLSIFIKQTSKQVIDSAGTCCSSRTFFWSVEFVNPYTNIETNKALRTNHPEITLPPTFPNVLMGTDHTFLSARRDKEEGNT